MSELTELLKALIEIPSPNPPGDHRAIAEFVALWLRNVGASVAVLAPAEKPEARSVVAVIGSGDPVIMLHAHLDTVPVGESEAAAWSSDPFRAVERNGRLYGKGSVDDKGPLAAMMIAFKKLAQSEHIGTLLLVAAAEEEVGGRLGTRWLADAGHLPQCDFIIVGEQTFNRVATAHKGVMRATIRTTGHSVHATNPDRGVNAINAMARVILALETYHQELSLRVHPLVGVPTCNIGVISGGATANAVADQCMIRLDRRMIPGESPEDVQHELQAVVESVGIAPATAEVGEFLYSSWFESKLQTPLGKAFLECSSSLTQTPAEPIGYLPGSDAKHLMGLVRGDMVIFGPGSYEVAHTYDEYVDIGELEQCEAVISRFLEQVMRLEVQR
ncbi:MAG: M20 family metallopeptidase [Meiothermus sp.]|uniref:M20 family metallopeptidase n=1 Tax=Meiothermus sp. TaxID=1955249 RepID=UPI0025DFECC8|nr:M20 family metallopeptidase [Meiothermus sp.]MCS7068634.1 M20 family metallopeptidase [Meiothermus sp.]MDW8424621.1 M20 family metallopeptidase [Meiothermus sp.]